VVYLPHTTIHHNTTTCRCVSVAFLNKCHAAPTHTHTLHTFPCPHTHHHTTHATRVRGDKTLLEPHLTTRLFFAAFPGHRPSPLGKSLARGVGGHSGSNATLAVLLSTDTGRPPRNSKQDCRRSGGHGWRQERGSRGAPFKDAGAYGSRASFKRMTCGMGVWRGEHGEQLIPSLLTVMRLVSAPI